MSLWKVRRKASLINLSLLLQLCPEYLVHLTWMVLEMGGKLSYCRCFVGCYFQNLFYLARILLVQLTSSFFSIQLISVHVVHPYCRLATTACKLLRFVLSDMIDNLSIRIHEFSSCILVPVSVDKMLLPWYMNLSINFSEPPFRVETSSFFFKHIYCFVCIHIVAIGTSYLLQTVP